MNLLLALICNLETTFSALKSKELDRLDTKERFLEFKEHIVLDTAADNEDNFVEFMMDVDGGNGAETIT